MINKINGFQTNIKLYLSDRVLPEKKSIEELKQFMELESTIENLKEKEFFDNKESKIADVIVTPDFHKGAGIPIGTVMLTKGFVVPQAMGNDINCGMRLLVTDIEEEKLFENMSKIQKKIRSIFFEGGRDIPMTTTQREAMFQNGLTGILETWKDTKEKGIWKFYLPKEQEEQLKNVQMKGSIFTKYTRGLEDFIKQSGTLSYDSQIGSIGGGNHFVEVQRIEEIFDGQTANAWGITKGKLLVMIHTGSLMIGHQSGMLARNISKDIYPSLVEHPTNRIYLLPEGNKFSKQWDNFWSTISNSANFAFANRMFLGLMLQKVFTETIGENKFSLLYDSPHNFIWKIEIEGEVYYLHRKGACSAQSMDKMEETPFAYYGEPVMIPGSMGSSSYLMAGSGTRETLWSASHGAGRKLSRGDAMHGNNKLFEEFIRKYSVITPIDPMRNDIKGRKDILKKWEEMLRAEAPYAYKDIEQVISVHTQHNMARKVARMTPVFTIKA